MVDQAYYDEYVSNGHAKHVEEAPPSPAPVKETERPKDDAPEATKEKDAPKKKASRPRKKAEEADEAQP